MTMHLFTIRTIAIFALSLASALIVMPTYASEYENPFWEAHANQPILAKLINGQKQQSITLKGYQDSILTAEISINGSVAEVGMPANAVLARQLRIPVPEMQAIHQLIRNKKYAEALEKIRPSAYPLLKYSALPSDYKVVHQLLFTLLQTLIENQQLNEADDLIQRIALQQAPLGYSRIALRLINAQIQMGYHVTASERLASLPLDGQKSQNMPFFIKSVHALRDAQQFKLAIPLYQSIEKKLADETRVSIRLWLSYCYARIGEKAASQKLLLSHRIKNKKATNFPLYKLVDGTNAYQTEKYHEALDHLSMGFVYSQSSDEWVPEMLYVMGDCYLKTGNSIGARNVWREITQLYKNTPWFSRAQYALNKSQ